MSARPLSYSMVILAKSLFLAALLLGQSVHAASPSVWNGGGGDNNWQTVTNWTSNNVPVPGTLYALQFGGSTQTTTNNDFDFTTTGGNNFASITFNAGAGAFTLGGNAITLNAGITNSSGLLQTINLDMVIAAGSHLITPGSGNVTLGGVLSGTGNISKINTAGNTGVLTLSGANTFSGTLAIGGPAGVGTTVRLANTNALQSAILAMSANNAVAFQSGIGSFTISGITHNTGTLALVDEVGAAVTLTIQGAGNQAATQSRAISGIAGSSIIFNMASDGLQTFSTATVGSALASYTINSGTVRMMGTAILNTGNQMTINGGTLDIAGGAVATQTQSFGSLSGIGGTITTSGTVTTAGITVNQTTDGTFEGNITQGTATTFSLTKNGAATLTLSGINTYNGVTAISAGALNIQSANALGSTAAGTTVASGAALQIQGGITTAEAFTDVRGTGIGNTGALRNISGNNTLSGLITVITASLINSDADTLTISNGITKANQALTVGGAGNTSISGDITGTTGTLTKDGSGTLTLSGTNNSTGITTISAGKLQFAKTASLYNSTDASWTKANIKVASGATAAFNVGGTGEFTTGNVTTLVTNLDRAITSNGLQAGSTIGFDTTNASGNTFTVADTIQDTTGTGGGAVGLAKLGANTLVLSAANTYTGLTTISAGTLVLDATGTIANSSGVNLGTSASQGTLDLTAKSSFAFASNQTVSGFGTIDIGAGKTVTVSGNLNPGNSPGQINITGDLALESTTVTTMEIAGLGGVKGTDFDNLTVSGAFTYGGTLSIVSFGGFDLYQVATYSLFDFSSQSGNFNTPSAVTFDGNALAYSSGVWSGSGGGFNYTFTLSTGDLNVVPEPATWALLALSLTTVVVMRRRRS